MLCALSLFVRTPTDKGPVAERGLELLEALLQTFDCFGIGVLLLHNAVECVGASQICVLDGVVQPHNSLSHDVHQLFGIAVGVVNVGEQVVAVVLVPSACVLEFSNKRENLFFVVCNIGALQRELRKPHRI